MSKNFKGYMGDQIGKLGPAVGRRWKGKMIYSAYQGNVSDPKSDRQLLVRARFALLGRLSATLLSAIHVGMALRATRLHITEGNLFMKSNGSAVSGSDPEALTVAYDELKLSEGNLTGVDFGTLSFTDPLEVSVPITNGNLEADDAHADDRVYVAVYCPDMDKAVVSPGTAKRSDNGVAVSVPASWQGMKVHVYGFVKARDAAKQPTLVSDTDYCGFGNIS